MPKIDDYNKSELSKRRESIDLKFGRDKEIEIDRLSKDILLYAPIKDEWIKKAADEDMIDFAEVMGKFLSPLKKEDKSSLTNSQIRNVYGEIKRIQMSIDKNDKNSWDVVKPSFLILKPKVAYAAGRNKNLGILTFKLLFDKLFDKITNKDEFLNFCYLLEAILAYHRSFGGL